MIVFGYIVDKKTPLEKPDVFCEVDDVSECVECVPKLIVGLDRAKQYAFDNGFEFDILNHHYPNGDMWTFRKTEKREYYEEDIDTFKRMSIQKQEDGVDYRYINVCSLKYSKLKRLHEILTSNGLKKEQNPIVIDGDMIYAPLDMKIVIGISLQFLKYIGVDREKVISKIRNEASNKVYFTTSKNMWKLRNWFCGKEYVIANLLYRNQENNK